MTFYFVDNEFYYNRPSVYGWGGDEGERFAFFDRAVLEALPLTRYDWCVLLFGTVVIFTASVIQERSQRTIREILDEKCLALRWAVLLAGIFAVVLMGVYGPGVQAAEFVYMQF